MIDRTSIGDCVDTCDSWNPSAGNHDGEFYYIDIASIDRDEKRIVDASAIPRKDAPSRARQLVKANDVLVSTVRPNLNAVAIVPANLDGATASTGFTVLRPRVDRIDPGYLFHWVKTPQFVDQMVKQATGASYPAVSDKIVRNAELPLPAIAEQRRIAAILDKADALRAKRREAIAKLDQLLQSVFLDMFGDPVTNPRAWPVVGISSLAEQLRDGPFGSNLKSEHYREAGVRVVRLQNIGVCKFLDEDKVYVSEEHFECLPRNHCRTGDVLIGTLGDPNLRACILPASVGRALNKADCLLFRPAAKVATAEYICGLLNCESLIRSASGLALGQTRLRVSMGRLKEMSVPAPPLREQRRFSEFVRRFEREESRVREGAARFQRLFESIQRHSFAGDV